MADWLYHAPLSAVRRMQSESPIAFAVLRGVQPILVSIQKSFDSCSDLHTGRTVAYRCSDMHAVVIDIDTESNDSAGLLIVEIKIGSECQDAMPGTEHRSRPPAVW